MSLKLGILVSGGGTNLQAILDATASGKLDAEPRIVVSNRSDAYALVRARAAGVETAIIRHRDYPSREAFDETLVNTLRQAEVEWVVLAGFMRVLTPVFLHAFAERIVNIHPSLLPAFPGVNAQRQALEYGAKIAGCTVHFVEQQVDAGPIIGQRAVVVREDDTEELLSQRILEQEHELLIDCLTAIAEDRVDLQREAGKRAIVRVRPR